MNGPFVSLFLLSFSSLYFEQTSVMVCLASSPVCYEPSGEASVGPQHEEALLPQERNSKIQRCSFQEWWCLCAGAAPKLSLSNERETVANPDESMNEQRKKRNRDIRPSLKASSISLNAEYQLRMGQQQLSLELKKAFVHVFKSLF